MDSQRLGVVTRGSLSKGLELKLDPEVSLEDLRAGMFAVAGGERFDFIALITDLELNATTPEALDAPPPAPGSLLREVLSGDSIYARVNLRPHLMVDRRPADPEKELLPVKTIPGHFTEVRRATPEDVERIFGREDGEGRHFQIGEPLDMEEIPVCVNLDTFAERSNGIFGKSGTGKTFLTRLVLCGLVRSKTAVNLIFDMHGEYGWKGTDEGRPGGQTKGLRQLFGPDRVQVFTLDPRPTFTSDFDLRIPYSSLEPEDVLGLQKVLGLTPTAAENSYLIYEHFGKNWFSKALELNPKEFAEETGAHEGAMGALRRRLVHLRQQCGGFLKPDAEVVGDGAVQRIIKNLESGVHTVIDFGRYNSLTHYILVANILTRRIDEEWRKKTEVHLSNPERNLKPPRVVITIEEAHKFLEPGIADQTIFGKIARELRKYNVTLLVVDQRPSQIEREVLSQLGTKICCLLDDEHDVEAVLAGTSGSGGLRSVLASLDTRQQALLFGHAVPMPVVVKTRDYNEQFWTTVGYHTLEERRATAATRRVVDFPDD
jgi:DNA helicase HerA-like ATPase